MSTKDQGISCWFSFDRQRDLGPKDRKSIAPSVRAGTCDSLSFGAPKVRHDLCRPLRASARLRKMSPP